MFSCVGVREPVDDAKGGDSRSERRCNAEGDGEGGSIVGPIYRK